MGFGIVIPDLKSKFLHQNVSDEFEVKYLSDTTQELDEVKGIIFGGGSSYVGLMTMKIEENIKNIYFLIDTGSAETSICEEVFNSFNLTLFNPNENIKARLNGRTTNVSLSSIYQDINILGTIFLDIHGAKLDIDLEERNFTIKFGDQIEFEDQIKFEDQISGDQIKSEDQISPTPQTSNLMDFGIIFIGLLIVVLAYLFVKFRRRETVLIDEQELHTHEQQEAEQKRKKKKGNLSKNKKDLL